MQTDQEVQIDVAIASAIGPGFRSAKHPQTRQNALFATRSYIGGERVSVFGAASVSATPTYLTVQLGDDLHIELSPSLLQYMNHSCDPNCFFDTTRMEVIALKEIAEGDEMTFFYPSTEWHMAQPFECFCGSPSCLTRISGADSIAEHILRSYRLTDFIQSKLSRR